MTKISTTETDHYQQFCLANSKGMSVKIANLGGTIQSIVVPDRYGNLVDVALGFGDVDSYVGLANSPYFGAIIGRYCNRICRGQFKIDGTVFDLATNNGRNHLHGGISGFDQAIWQCATTLGEGYSEVRLQYRSADSEEGYPGNLDVVVTYRLTEKCEIIVSYAATTDRPTHVNLTQHTYFNLKGEGNGDVLDHEVFLNADRFTPVDSTSIPTGDIVSVTDTPFDFRTPKPIGLEIGDAHPQLVIGRGYDHNLLINGQLGELTLAASVYEPSSGRVLEVLTEEPGVQFYTGNFLDGSLQGKSGSLYEQYGGFCLETQHYPDSPNQPEFPSTLLRPGEEFKSQTVYRFSIRD